MQREHDARIFRAIKQFDDMTWAERDEQCYAQPAAKTEPCEGCGAIRFLVGCAGMMIIIAIILTALASGAPQ